MILEIYQIISEYLSFIHSSNLIKLNKSVYDNIKIYDLNLESKYTKHLTINILSQKRFSKLKKIKLCENIFVQDLDIFKNTLEELNCAKFTYHSQYTIINQASIKNLINLKKMNAYGNEKIFDVNHLSNLEELNCGNNSGIDQLGLSKLNKLKILNAHNNSKIKDVSHLANTLVYLNCSWDCGINQKGIQLLKVLKIINVQNNININRNIFI